MRSVLLKRCLQRGKREIKHFRVYLPSSFRNLPRASTTVYNRTLRSWVWVSFLSLTSLVFTECLIHNLQCEIMWYSVSVRAGGLAVNKNSKQSYSESVMFHLIGDSVRWELTIKVRWGRLLSRRCFSRTPHLLCLWRQTDRQTDRLIFNEKVVQWTGGRGVQELEDYSVNCRELLVVCQH